MAYIGLTAEVGRKLIGKAMAADAAMVATGYVATARQGTLSWAMFGVSSLAFGYLLCLLVGRVTRSLVTAGQPSRVPPGRCRPEPTPSTRPSKPSKTPTRASRR